MTSPTAFKLRHTPDNEPYIPLSTRSSTPMFLTQLRRTDVAALTVLMSHPDVSIRLMNVPYPYKESDAEFWISRQLTPEDSPMKELPMAVIRAGDPTIGKLVGSIGINLRATVGSTSSEHEEYVLGYTLHPEWHKRGIMPEAVKAAMWHGSTQMGMKRLVVQVAEDNYGSRKVVESIAGFEELPERKVVETWPLTKGGGKKVVRMWKWEST